MSETLILSRLRLRRTPGAAGTLAALLDAAVEVEGDHRLVWSLFADDGALRRDFLYRRAGPGRFYALSRRWPEDAHGLWQIESKAFEPALRAGDRLRFSLRANAVVRHRDRPRKRDDVVMDRKKHPRDGDGDLSPREIERLAGLEWLAARAARAGFAVAPDDVGVQGYHQHRLSRRSGGRRVTFSTLDFEGLLTVAEPEAFTAMLGRGLGAAKAFGCGLMLIRRARGGS